MPCLRLPRPPAVLASVLAAGILLAAAGCAGHITPLGPEPPQPSHLGSPIVLQAMSVRYPAPAGGCSVGFTKLSGSNTSLCGRPLGAPVTITTAAVSPVSTSEPHPPPGQPAGPPVYQINVILPAADWAALTAVTTKAYNARGALEVKVADKGWDDPMVDQPLTGGGLQIILLSMNQARQLYRLLVPSG
jgi:hypothetical protein